MKDQIYKNILKINGFKYSRNIWEREDGIEINNTAGQYNICFGTGDVIYNQTKEECIGELVLRNIINRLF